jgi:hypothetical protein
MMDTQKFQEAAGRCTLPFVYSGERLNEEKCKKALKKINVEGTVLAVVTSDELLGPVGLAVTDTGIYYNLMSGTGEDVTKLAKIKGALLYSESVIMDAAAAKDKAGRLNCELTVWENVRRRPYNFHCSFVEDIFFDDGTPVEAMVAEFAGLMKTLVSESGAEAAASAGEMAESFGKKLENEFDFVWHTTHTVMRVEDDSIFISKVKVNEKTQVQTPLGDLTIPRTAIEHIRKKRFFDWRVLLSVTAAGAAIGFGLIGGVYVLLLFALIGLCCSFSSMVVIRRKDGSKFKVRLSTNEENASEYERLMQVVFK